MDTNLPVRQKKLNLFVTLVTEVSLISRARTSDLRESLYLEDFSENRSVLFPSALDTIAEEDSSRVTETSRFRTALFVWLCQTLYWWNTIQNISNPLGFTDLSTQ
jgi:hypothetical protein